ncbi:MAG: GNAT family N-acetyltransferase [Aeromicrobium erythreum]
MVGTVTVEVDDPRRSDVLALLREHLDDMYATSPAESVHALDPEALRGPGLTFVAARDADGTLLGVGALRIDRGAEVWAEVKSMRTTRAARGRGVAATVLAHLLERARAAGCAVVRLETGSQDYFAAARRLYARHGFVEVGPFGAYVEDPSSVFMERRADPSAAARNDEGPA